MAKQYKLKSQASEEWELAPEEPKGVEEIRTFFTAPDPDKEMDKLSYKQPCVEILREYLAVKDKLEALQAIQKQLRNDIVNLWESKPGAYGLEGLTLIIKPRAGQVKVNYEAFIEDEIGPEALQELLQTKDLVKQGKSTSKYVEQGEGGVSIEVLPQPK